MQADLDGKLKYAWSWVYFHMALNDLMDEVQSRQLSAGEIDHTIPGDLVSADISQLEAPLGISPVDIPNPDKDDPGEDEFLKATLYMWEDGNKACGMAGIYNRRRGLIILDDDDQEHHDYARECMEEHRSHL